MSAERVPVALLTGFLGAGKTTLLNRLLARSDMADTLVIINEYGEAALDHRLVTHAPENVLTDVAGGCICCTLRGDLVRTLREAHWRFARAGRRQFERVIIESTGLADPAPILRTLASDARIAERYRLNCTLAVVDACHGAATLSTQPEAVRQIAAADRLLISKTDLVPAHEANALRSALRTLNPFAQTDLLSDIALAPALLEPPSSLRMRSVPATPASIDHEVTSEVLTLDVTLDPDTVARWLDAWPDVAGPHLLRMKALLDVAGEPGPRVVHGVQHLLHPVEVQEHWPDAERGSTVVCITRGMDGARLRRWLDLLRS